MWWSHCDDSPNKQYCGDDSRDDVPCSSVMMNNGLCDDFCKKTRDLYRSFVMIWGWSLRLERRFLGQLRVEKTRRLCFNYIVWFDHLDSVRSKVLSFFLLSNRWWICDDFFRDDWWISVIIMWWPHCDDSPNKQYCGDDSLVKHVMMMRLCDDNSVMM